MKWISQPFPVWAWMLVVPLPISQEEWLGVVETYVGGLSSFGPHQSESPIAMADGGFQRQAGSGCQPWDTAPPSLRHGVAPWLPQHSQASRSGLPRCDLFQVASDGSRRAEEASVHGTSP